MSFHSKNYLRVITLGSEILQIIDEEDKLKIAELKCEEIENLLKSWESELQRQKDAQQSTHYELICSLQSLQVCVYTIYYVCFVPKDLRTTQLYFQSVIKLLLPISPDLVNDFNKCLSAS